MLWERLVEVDELCLDGGGAVVVGDVDDGAVVMEGEGAGADLEAVAVAMEEGCVDVSAEDEVKEAVLGEVAEESVVGDAASPAERCAVGAEEGEVRDERAAFAVASWSDELSEDGGVLLEGGDAAGAPGRHGARGVEEEEPEGADGAFEGEVSGVVAEAIEASDGVESCGGGLGAVDVGVVVSGEVDESSGEALSERLEELECAVEFVGIADGAEVAGADGEVGLESVGELEESVEGGPVLVGLSAESLGECAEESLVGQPGEAVWRGAAVEVGEVEDAHGGGAVHCRRQTRSAPAAVKRRLGSAPATKGGSQPFLPATKRTCPMM